MRPVIIHTDGGCRGNPGVGAWAFVLIDATSGTRLERGAVDGYTTNNKMELSAVIEALTTLSRPCRVTLYSDSQYVINGVTKWIHGWVKKGWKTKGKTPVKNKELWQALVREKAKHDITFEWVRGHSGHAGNERCDEIVNTLMDRYKAGEKDATWDVREERASE